MQELILITINTHCKMSHSLIPLIPQLHLQINIFQHSKIFYDISILLDRHPKMLQVAYLANIVKCHKIAYFGKTDNFSYFFCNMSLV